MGRRKKRGNIKKIRIENKILSFPVVHYRSFTTTQCCDGLTREVELVFAILFFFFWAPLVVVHAAFSLVMIILYAVVLLSPPCFNAVVATFLFHSAWMEDMDRSKRGRVYPLKPSAIIYAGFTHKYVSHLLTALTKATNLFSCGGNKDESMEKMVRFEVDMALVLSASGFKWSHALKNNLEQRVSSNQLHQFAPCQSSILRVNKHKTLDHLRTPLSIPGPLVLTKSNGPKRRCQRRSYNKKTRGEKGFGCRIRILRRILPGGNEMGLCELLSEVESYVVCLQLQVNALKSLVETP